MGEQVPKRDEQQGLLGPPRFTLRALLTAVTALCCLFALMAAVGFLWSAAIVLFACLVAAHVLGNSLGTKLNERTNRPADDERSRPPRAADAVAWHVVPPRLAQRARLSRVTLLMAVVGGVAGGWIGGTNLAGLYPAASAAAVALAIGSSAVLGAFGGFAISSFLSVLRQAWREALRASAAGPATRGEPSSPRH